MVLTSAADLRWSTLSGASLRGADLRAALLEGVDLRSADLTGALLDAAALLRSHWQAGSGIRHDWLNAAQFHNAAVTEAEAGRWPAAEQLLYGCPCVGSRRTFELGWPGGESGIPRQSCLLLHRTLRRLKSFREPAEIFSLQSASSNYSFRFLRALNLN